MTILTVSVPNPGALTDFDVEFHSEGVMKGTALDVEEIMVDILRDDANIPTVLIFDADWNEQLGRIDFQKA